MPENENSEDHPMVLCQGDNCKRKWFHFTCIGQALDWKADGGDYFCPSQKKEVDSTYTAVFILS